MLVLVNHIKNLFTELFFSHCEHFAGPVLTCHLTGCGLPSLDYSEKNAKWEPSNRVMNTFGPTLSII